MTCIMEMERAEATSLTVGEVVTMRKIEVFEDEGLNWEQYIEARAEARGMDIGEARGVATG